MIWPTMTGILAATLARIWARADTDVEALMPATCADSNFTSLETSSIVAAETAKGIAIKIPNVAAANFLAPIKFFICVASW